MYSEHVDLSTKFSPTPNNSKVTILVDVLGRAMTQAVP